MADREDALAQRQSKIKWKPLLITLLVGAVPTIVFFLFDLWWWTIGCLLLTLFVAIFFLGSELYPAAFTLFAFLAITSISASWLEGAIPVQWEWSPGWKVALSIGAGALLGILIPAVFWFLILFVSTTWILAVSDSFDISWWKAFIFVATRIFDMSQNYYVVENGKVAVDTSKGILAKLGGPGLLIVRPGNVVVLERAGQVRFVGPGTHRTKRFEFIKTPHDIKGIVDLKGQFTRFVAPNVLTKDGIPLQIEVGESYQIETKAKTDARPESHYEGGDATTPVLGGPEYPVYEAIIRKAVFATTAGGWQGLFPWGAINTMRDVVATYTLDEIFSPERSDSHDPNERTIREIELKVNKLFNPAWAGVMFKGLDILEVTMPEEVKERMMKRWTTPVDRLVKVEEARAEAEAITERSKGQAMALRTMEKIKAGARQDMVRMIDDLLDTLTQSGRDQVAINFVSVIEELTRRVGQDESTAVRYIETMQAIMQSDGPKSFIITPPNTPKNALPSPPAPTMPEVRIHGEEEPGPKKKGK